MCGDTARTDVRIEVGDGAVLLIILCARPVWPVLDVLAGADLRRAELRQLQGVRRREKLEVEQVRGDPLVLCTSKALWSATAAAATEYESYSAGVVVICKRACNARPFHPP